MVKQLSAFWSRLTDSSLCELIELLGDNIPFPEVDPKKRDRVFNQWRTFWLFLGQILSATQSCSETLKKAQAWLYLAQAEKEVEAQVDKKKHLIQHIRLLSVSNQA
ncbi:MAG TPA: hypothetical protein VK469_05545 [Candidatus Kapabacteria bacterium]|nr:hypothetical protein [Candidatus Kapabacteria bacterium]